MNRLARAQRLWMGRRLALLGGSAAASAVAIIFQLTRLVREPYGAAVQGVSLLVTLIVLAILLRLVRLQIGGPGLDAPSGERHAHRASVREAPLVALAGVAVVAIVVLATPRLIVKAQIADPSEVAVDLPVPSEPSPAPVRREIASTAPARWTPRQGSDGAIATPQIEINYRLLEGGQDEFSRDPMQEPVDPTRPGRDAIFRVQPDEPSLPPVHVGIGAMIALTRGNLDLTGDAGRFELDLDTARGEQTFEMGVDVTAEFALTPDNALKIMYAGLAMSERGHLDADTPLGSVTGAAGDRFEFDMRWSHLYMALARRITGYTRGSWFDLSVHAGAMVDHTLAEFESEATAVGAESEDGERGWVAPGLGFSMAVRGPGPAGFVLEVVQSLPVNIGGQAIALTDLRTGLTADLAEGASLFLGYRYVRGVYRLFDEPLVREGGRTAADIAVRGPVIGLDFRF